MKNTHTAGNHSINIKVWLVRVLLMSPFTFYMLLFSMSHLILTNFKLHSGLPKHDWILVQFMWTNVHKHNAIFRFQRNSSLFICVRIGACSFLFLNRIWIPRFPLTSLHFTTCNNLLLACTFCLFHLNACVYEHVHPGNNKRVKCCKTIAAAHYHFVMYVNIVAEEESKKKALLPACLSSHLLSSIFSSVSLSKEVKCLKRCIEVSLYALYDGYVVWHNAFKHPSQIKWQMLLFASWIFYWPGWFWEFKLRFLSSCSVQSSSVTFQTPFTHTITG